MNPDPDPEFLHKVAGDKKKKSFFFIHLVFSYQPNWGKEWFLYLLDLKRQESVKTLFNS